MGMQTDVVRRLFAVEEYDRMVEVGVLGNEDRGQRARVWVQSPATFPDATIPVAGIFA